MNGIAAWYRRRRLVAALRCLSPMQRTIFLALRDDEAKYDDLATQLGIGVDDVEREFAAALVALTDSWER